MPAAPSNVASHRVLWLSLSWLTRCLVAAVFILAAIGKIEGLARFAKEIRDYQLIPAEWSNALAYTLPWVELFVALLLIAGPWRREAWLLMGALVVSFTLAKLSVLLRGMSIDCGCFGEIDFLKKALGGRVGAALSAVIHSLNEFSSSRWGIALNLGLLTCWLLDGYGERQARRLKKMAAQELQITNKSAAGVS